MSITCKQYVQVRQNLLNFRKQNRMKRKIFPPSSPLKMITGQEKLGLKTIIDHSKKYSFSSHKVFQPESVNLVQNINLYGCIIQLGKKKKSIFQRERHTQRQNKCKLFKHESSKMQMKFKQYEVWNTVWKQKKQKNNPKQSSDFRQTFIHLSSKHTVERTMQNQSMHTGIMKNGLKKC